MPIVAVLPVKQFSLGKGRLARALSPSSRIALGRALAARTAGVAIEAGMEPLVVAADSDVEIWAADMQYAVVPDPDEGLNGAATAGVAWCIDRGQAWIVIHTDLPLLRAIDLDALGVAMSHAGAVIAPSSDGGTSAFGGVQEAPTFGYGPGSFHRHLQQARRAAVVARTGLLHDLDTPADLASARSHHLGRWMEALLH